MATLPGGRTGAAKWELQAVRRRTFVQFDVLGQPHSLVHFGGVTVPDPGLFNHLVDADVGLRQFCHVMDAEKVEGCALFSPRRVV